MKCSEAKSLFSSYLDGAVTGRQMHGLGLHLEGCPDCSQEYALLKRTQSMVMALGRKPAPADLGLRLRLAISRESSLVRRNYWQGLQVRTENLINAFMVPATAGALTAVIIFGLLIGFFALPSQLRASSDDVPTLLYTPPQLAQSPFASGMGTMSADSLVVEAYIDANGRVQDYRILSAPKDHPSLVPELENMLIFTVFRPATTFGRPMPGKAVISFSKINVKG